MGHSNEWFMRMYIWMFVLGMWGCRVYSSAVGCMGECFYWCRMLLYVDV